MESTSLRSLIRERRTIRSFLDKDVPSEIMLELLNDAAYAPNHKMREPWSFILIRDRGKKELLKHVVSSYIRLEILKDMAPEFIEKKKKQLEQVFLKCPIHLIMLMESSANQKVWEEDYAATSALIQNLQLLAWEKGIGMVWKTNPYIYDPGFNQDMKLPENKKIIGVLHIGYPEKIPEVKVRTDIKSKLEIRN